MRGNQIVTLVLLLTLGAVAAAAAETAPHTGSAKAQPPAMQANTTGNASPTQGSSEQAQEQQLMSGQAWAKFCDRMKALGPEMLSDKYPGDPLARAEGFRHLARMVILSLEWRLEDANPDFPLFLRHDDDITEWGGPNVDNTYLRAPIDGESTYRVDGNVTGLHNLIISTGDGDMHEGKYYVGGDLDLSRLHVDKKGHFELILSPTKHDGNWLQTKPGVTFVNIREYYYDWAKEHPGEFHIVKVGNEGKAPPRITPAEVSRRLERAAAWIESGIPYWNDFMRQAHEKLPQDNQMSPPAAVAGGSTNIAYGNGFFNLADDEALIVESQVPKARYWDLQYYTLGWFEPPDYANRVTSLNGAQTHVDRDGKVRWVVAHHDPGVQNWIDTEGRRRGMLTYRWVWTKDRPRPVARVVKFADLKKALPADTPAFSAAQRRAQIMTRRRHVERRFHK